jgi:adenylyl-sulfate kinase
MQKITFKKPGTVWFTGLACSGKTSISKRVKETLKKEGIGAVVLDSDELRQTVSKNFGYTKEERDKHMKLVSEICLLLTRQGIINIASVISSTRAIRDEARKKIKDFIEVYVKCPIEICRQRDAKGHYKEFDKGRLDYFVGINIEYEHPLNPEVILETAKEDIETCAGKVISAMEKKGFIKIEKEQR